MIYQLTTCWRIEFAFSKESQVHQHLSDLYCAPGKLWLLKIRSCHHPIPPIDAYNNSLCILTHIFLVANQSACYRMSFMRHAMLLAFAFQGGFSLPQVLLTPQQAVLIRGLLIHLSKPRMMHQTELRWFLGEIPCIQWFLKVYWNDFIWFHWYVYYMYHVHT